MFNPLDLILDFVPWWVLMPAAIAILVVVWRVLGSKATLAALAVLGALGAYRSGRKARESEEATRRAVEKLRGTEEHLEMQRESTEADRQARDLPDEEARREAMKWARR
jgi:uncharacterized membrane protein YqjE